LFLSKNDVTERQTMSQDSVLWAHLATGMIAWIAGGGLTRIAAWSLPTLVRVPLLELWYRRAGPRTAQVAHP
jgi:hypothetical protein